MLDWANLIGGFFMGLIASGIVAVLYEHATRPWLEILPDTGRAQGQHQNGQPHEFYHLKVRNMPPILGLLPSRKPAWSCKVSIELMSEDGICLLDEPIIGKWTSQPEPLLPVNDRGNIQYVIDPAGVIYARKIDIYSHDDQRFSVALKYENNSECYLFSNESYSYPPNWQNPGWRLGPGDHKLRITVYYERGHQTRNFILSNKGDSRDDLSIVPS